MIVLICFVLVSACKNEDFIKVDAQTIAQNELKSIDLSEVDSYPLFSSCDETSSLKLQKSCFVKEIHNWLKPYLDTISLDIVKADTIQLFLSVDRSGLLVQDSAYSTSLSKSKLLKPFYNPPKLYPAQKRGVPVKVSFQMPVIITPN